MLISFILNIISLDTNQGIQRFRKASNYYKTHHIWERGFNVIPSKPKYRTTTIFDKQDLYEPISCFRIPSIIGNNRRFIAFSEARLFNCSDDAQKGIVIKKSQDGGLTWSNFSWVVQPNNHTDFRSGNPTSIYDSFNNKFILHYASGAYFYNNKWNAIPSKTVYQIESYDNGVTWSNPKSLNNFLKQWVGIVPGPGNGVVITNGRYLFTGHYLTSERYNGAVISYYSDDNGTTYQISGSSLYHMDESSISVINTTSVIINMRTGNNTRSLSVSNNNGESWGSIYSDSQLIDPICQGSSITLNGVHFFINPHMLYSRSNLTLSYRSNINSNWNFRQITDEFVFADYSGILNQLVWINGEKYIGIIWGSCEIALPFRVWCFDEKTWNIKFTLVKWFLNN